MYNKRTWALCPGAFDSFSKYQWAIGHYHLFLVQTSKLSNKQFVIRAHWPGCFFEKNKRTCSLIRESRVQLVKKGQNLSLFFLFLILLRSRRIWLRNHEKIELQRISAFIAKINFAKIEMFMQIYLQKMEYVVLCGQTGGVSNMKHMIWFKLI